MGDRLDSEHYGEEQFRNFTRALLEDLQALERMIDSGMIESGVRRIGAEQEMFLVDQAGRPAPRAVEVLDQIGDPRFTTELARFNLEANIDPIVFSHDCFRMMDDRLTGLVQWARRGARACGARVCLTGILPTLSLDDLSLDNMTPNPRYLALNREMSRLRGGEFRVDIKGLDELDTSHDNVMLESCNTSFQIHFQVGPEEFAKLYNLAQLVTAPVLAAAVNSPLLLGRRLWQETRIALFQQSVDSRSKTHQARGHPSRVSFGDRWVDRSIIEIYREDIARFRVLLATGIEEDSLQAVARSDIPPLSALRLHTGTVYRWNRACYGMHQGTAHLRIENRALPAGPTVVDEVANASFFFGLMAALADELEDVGSVMAFDDAKGNFIAAARHGLKAQFSWLNAETLTARDLILTRLLPKARDGLNRAGIAGPDIERYLGVVAERVESARTGAQWLLDSYAALSADATGDETFRTLTTATISRQLRGEPVSRWTAATLAESEGWRESFQTVGQFMTTDIFSVQPQDLVNLAASLMEWEHLRHVPVEDDEGKLVGLVSHRAFLRLVASGLLKSGAESVAVNTIMRTDLVTVTAETPTLQAIEKMRRHKVGCLPVVDGARLVGIVTERDFLRVAGKFMEQRLLEP